MDMEWFRDLSITVLGFMSTVILIFGAILAYRLYRKAKSILQLTESIVKNANEIVTLIKEIIQAIASLSGSDSGHLCRIRRHN